MEAKAKKRVGFFSFTCDEGCSIYVTEIFNNKLIEWLEKMELKYFLSVKEATPIGDYDIAIIEGVINSESELLELKKIRERSKILIVMGTCGMNGQPSAQRNLFNEDQHNNVEDEVRKNKLLEKVLLPKDVVKVDDEIAGCPVLEEKFVEVFEKYLNQ